MRKLRWGWTAGAWLVGAAPAVAQTIVIDNTDAGFSILAGSWSTGSSSADKFGADYRFAGVTSGGTPTATCRWQPTIATSGVYEVAIWYPQGSNRSPDAPFTIEYDGGSVTRRWNQQSLGGQWNVLGRFPFAAGTSGRVVLGNHASGNLVLADAVRFRRATSVEFRGLWVSRFDWASTNLTTAQNDIIHFFTEAANAGVNAVFFQVRGQMDTFYPSPYETWSPLIGGSDPGWDPLQFAIDEAHRRGLEFHAYINTHTGWQSGSSTPPSNPNHVYYQHLDASNPAARDWLIHDEAGNPVQYEESSYSWVAPGVPDATYHTRREILYVVQNYDVDGVHFDRIRTPGSEYSHDPISEARRAGEGNPASLGFADWTRDQITRANRDIYAEIAALKPYVKVSAAVLGLYDQSHYPGYPSGFQYGFSRAYQDGQTWIQTGAMDALCPLIGAWPKDGSLPDYDDLLPDWIANDGGRHIYASTSDGQAYSVALDIIADTRTMGGEGNAAFSASGIDSQALWDDYATGPYVEPATLPPMAWKDSPTTAILYGYVRDAVTNEPLTDAHVTRTGSAYTALGAADGFYSMLLVPPGTYTMTATKSGYAPTVVSSVTVAAGDVRRQDFLLDVSAPEPCEPILLTDFEGYADGAAVMFRPPRFSGSTDEDLVTTPNVAEVTDAVPAFSGTKSCRVEWQWIDADPQRWVRLTTSGTANKPNPTIDLHKPIRVRLRLDSGSLRLCMGVRETETSAEIGDDGGTSGPIEWIGAASTITGAPQGKLVTGSPGVWQTVVFDPESDPILAFTGDGALPPAGTKGVLEHLGITITDAAGPFVLYLDDVEQVCPDTGAAGDFDDDGDVDVADFTFFQLCFNGPGQSYPQPACAHADFDGDGDVDVADFTQFQVCFNGPDSPPPAACQ